jgi:phosphate-selective porin
VPAALKAVELGGAFTTTDVPEGSNHLQGQRVLGGDFFPRSVYVRGRRLRLGAEVNWSPGPFSVKWEFLRSGEARKGQGVGSEEGVDNDLPDLVGRGWYVSGTWVVTGEKKAGGVEPRKEFLRGGVGAIEIGTRYEELSFSSGAQVEAPSRSPRAPYVTPATDRVWTMGVTWYVNRWVKIQANGIREQVTGGVDGPASEPAAAWSWVCRLQFVL